MPLSSFATDGDARQNCHEWALLPYLPDLKTVRQPKALALVSAHEFSRLLPIAPVTFPPHTTATNANPAPAA
jgi:hypothetical protein